MWRSSYPEAHSLLLVFIADRVEWDTHNCMISFQKFFAYCISERTSNQKTRKSWGDARDAPACPSRRRIVLYISIRDSYKMWLTANNALWSTPLTLHFWFKVEIRCFDMILTNIGVHFVVKIHPCRLAAWWAEPREDWALSLRALAAGSAGAPRRPERLQSGSERSTTVSSLHRDPDQLQVGQTTRRIREVQGRPARGPQGGASLNNNGT